MNISPALFWWNVVSFSKAAHILTVIWSRQIVTLTRKFDNLPTCYSNLLFIIYLFVSCLQILVEPLSLLNLILFKWTFDVVAFTFALLFHVLFRPFVSQSLSSLFSSFSFPLSTSSHLRLLPSIIQKHCHGTRQGKSSPCMIQKLDSTFRIQGPLTVYPIESVDTLHSCTDKFRWLFPLISKYHFLKHLIGLSDYMWSWIEHG